MVQRVTYRRKLMYNTASNKYKLVRTPGGKQSMHYIKKRVAGPHTSASMEHKRLPGTRALRVVDARNRSKRYSTVNRAYGGVLTHDQVRDRVIRAFLLEEQKIAKRVNLRRRQ
eukprot:PhM_4_TR11989/c0_g1_i1/m.13132/K02915/RP-L34e, RPL34; large subunit ribosomal protein L34e